MIILNLALRQTNKFTKIKFPKKLIKILFAFNVNKNDIFVNFEIFFRCPDNQCGQLTAKFAARMLAYERPSKQSGVRPRLMVQMFLNNDSEMIMFGR